MKVCDGCGGKRDEFSDKIHGTLVMFTEEAKEQHIDVHLDLCQGCYFMLCERVSGKNPAYEAWKNGEING